MKWTPGSKTLGKSITHSRGNCSHLSFAHLPLYNSFILSLTLLGGLTRKSIFWPLFFIIGIGFSCVCRAQACYDIIRLLGYVVELSSWFSDHLQLEGPFIYATCKVGRITRLINNKVCLICYENGLELDLGTSEWPNLLFYSCCIPMFWMH